MNQAHKKNGRYISINPIQSQYVHFIENHFRDTLYIVATNLFTTVFASALTKIDPLVLI